MENSHLLEECIVVTSNGVLLKVMVTPNSKTQGIEGVDKWRKSLKVRVRSRAEKGKANKELINFLSSSLSLPTSDLTIIKGETSRTKEIKIRNLTEEELIKRLLNKL